MTLHSGRKPVGTERTETEPVNGAPVSQGGYDRADRERTAHRALRADRLRAERTTDPSSPFCSARHT